MPASPSWRGRVGSAQPRYSLPETIRAYALERLEEANEHAAIAERHLRVAGAAQVPERLRPALRLVDDLRLVLRLEPRRVHLGEHDAERLFPGRRDALGDAVTHELSALDPIKRDPGYGYNMFATQSPFWEERLMALTVATGFVVDDAIVVVENISRHVEAGMSRLEAALQGAREVGFTVLSMSLSLIAVFIPILLIGGIIGRLFREFAVTLSVSIVVSASAWGAGPVWRPGLVWGPGPGVVLVKSSVSVGMVACWQALL